MAIEVLQDIITELADKLGIYGAHGEEGGEGCEAITCTPKRPCRMCFESDLRDRILAAVSIEKKLAGVTP